MLLSARPLWIYLCMSLVIMTLSQGAMAGAGDIPAVGTVSGAQASPPLDPEALNAQLPTVTKSESAPKTVPPVLGPFTPLEDVINITWDQLKACSTDTDCVLVPDFVGCCQERPLNLRYAELVEENRDALHAKFTPTDTLTMCQAAKCVPPHRAASCVTGVCVAVYPQPRLEKVQALNIATGVLDKKLHQLDFGTPIFAFDHDKNQWWVDFGPLVSQHTARII